MGELEVRAGGCWVTPANLMYDKTRCALQVNKL